MPVPMLVGTVGFMLGTGGSAIVGITLGEGDKARADRYFSEPLSHICLCVATFCDYVRKVPPV